MHRSRGARKPIRTSSAANDAAALLRECGIDYRMFEMTARKDSLSLPSRTPAYVDRETGAAELRISSETWDKWVKNGTLPKAAPGFPASTPRWRWVDVDRKLSGRPATSDADRFVEAAGRLHGAPKSRPPYRRAARKPAGARKVLTLLPGTSG